MRLNLNSSLFNIYPKKLSLGSGKYDSLVQNGQVHSNLQKKIFT